MFQLSKGSLKKILDGNNVSDPILQIIQMKNIQNNMDGMTRYKVTLYDGETQHTFGILATQKNSLVESNQLRIGSVIKLEEYAANVLSKDPPKVAIILLNFEILGEMDPNSKPQATNAISQPSKQIQNENIEPNKPNNQTNTKSFFSKKENDFEKAQSTNPPGTFNGFKIFGISSLNPYQNKWAIKARVTNKSNIRTYSNARGEGKLFNVELIDSTGEIRANGFNEQVDKFYEMLQIDQVYYISKANLKTANKQYCKLDNDYEMTFNNETVIQPCEETDDLPRINLNLVKIKEISNHAANDFVDVIGVVRSVGDVTTIITKSTNRELKKRELSIVDNSECAITATLWGKQAEDYDPSDSYPVILLKGAKIGDYNGKTLSVASTTVVQINPDLPEAHTVKGWFEQGGSESDIQDLSSQGMAAAGANSGGPISGHSNWKFLDQLKDEKLGMGDKADYFSTKAYVLYAKKDNSMYMACPGENCNKKIFDQNDGTYRCEKCARNYPNFKWRMILNINLADFAESNWATCFQETAETILGIGTEELGELKNSNDPKFDEIFSECAFKEFNFKLRAKMETYNDERRVKVSAVTVEPVDYAQSGRRILQKIKQFAKEQV
uniref:Replication protein A subunit n=1 Tax=Brachionus ibericus TaxID=183141 RepID=E9K6N2_9BILA|nr:replication protein A1 [Brachionus ibericus]